MYIQLLLGEVVYNINWACWLIMWFEVTLSRFLHVLNANYWEWLKSTNVSRFALFSCSAINLLQVFSKMVARWRHIKHCCLLMENWPSHTHTHLCLEQFLQENKCTALLWDIHEDSGFSYMQRGILGIFWQLPFSIS